MAQIRTHYDNLKVARNAPPDVIRAAYRALSQRFHPDKNLGNTEAARIMAIINASYEVLSDPAKRREHDLWIREVEARSDLRVEPEQTIHSTTETKHSVASPILLRLVLPLYNMVKGLVIWAFSYIIGIGILICIIWMIGSAIDLFGEKNAPPLGSKPYQANPAPVRSAYVRPSTAPNGNPWPVSSGYVKDYQHLHADGLSSVTVDNSQNDSDVFVKLVSLDGPEAYPVRQFYISAFGSFTLKNITAGSYDIRYRDLYNGGLSRSEAFNFEENSTRDGTQFSNITITLYKVRNGNMQTYGLSETEF